MFFPAVQGSAKQQDMMACHLIPATEWSVHRWNFHVKADFLTDFMSSDLRRSTIFSLPSNFRHPARSDVLFRCFYIFLLPLLLVLFLGVLMMADGVGGGAH